MCAAVFDNISMKEICITHWAQKYVLMLMYYSATVKVYNIDKSYPFYIAAVLDFKMAAM